jgi:Na+/H+ antiporter NhaD/arsenite permease-like protein
MPIDNSAVVANVLITFIFSAVALQFLFPSNRILPLDRRLSGLFGAALCSVVLWSFKNSHINPGILIDVPVLLVLISIMAINFIIMHQSLLQRSIHLMQSYIRRHRKRGFWLVSLIAFVTSPFITNDGLCILLVSPVLDAFPSHHESLTTSKRELQDKERLFYMLAIACSANIGSSATFTGNPQNIIIAQYLSEFMTGGTFFGFLFLPAVISWLITIGTINYYRLNFDFDSPERSTSTPGLMHIADSGKIAPGIELSKAELPESHSWKLAGDCAIITCGFFCALIVCQFGAFFPLPMLYPIVAIFLVVTVLLYNYYSHFFVAGEMLVSFPAFGHCSKKSSEYELQKSNTQTEISEDLCATEEVFVDSDTNRVIAKISLFVEALFNDLDYNLLIIFSGLFIVAGSFVATGIPSLIWKVRH